MNIWQAIAEAIRRHSGRKCHWCRDGLMRDFERLKWQNCTKCHGFGCLEE